MSDALDSLGSGGRSLWDAVSDAHELEATQLVQLAEACRIKDRCDALDRAVRSLEDSGDLREYISAVAQANASANQMKQLLAALRLPDSQSGKRPQFRGPRGAVAPQVPGGKVSSLDRARAAKSS